MRGSIMAEVRAECKRLGIPFAAVADAKACLQEQERSQRERQNEVRQVAWGEASSPGCWPFWRFGFAARWGRKYAEGDVTAVPGYDEIHQVVATQFPEYAAADGEDKLFDFLFSPYVPFTPKRELWWQALELVQNQSGEQEWGEVCEVSFSEEF